MKGNFKGGKQAWGKFAQAANENFWATGRAGSSTDPYLAWSSGGYHGGFDTKVVGKGADWSTRR